MPKAGTTVKLPDYIAKRIVAAQVAHNASDENVQSGVGRKWVKGDAARAAVLAGVEYFETHAITVDQVEAAAGMKGVPFALRLSPALRDRVLSILTACRKDDEVCAAVTRLHESAVIRATMVKGLELMLA